MATQAEFGSVARPIASGWRIAGLTVLAALALLATSFAASQVARQRAATDLAIRARDALPLAAGALTGVIDEQRLIPLVLARDPEVTAALLAADPADERRLDAKLKAIADEAGSAVIYLIDRTGIAIAASNAGQPDSFVGSDYGFRGYFTDAMRDGAAAQFALGTVSRRPGLYLSRRVDSVKGPLGVVVTKVEFDDLEDRWREAGFVIHVTDSEGVVLVTSVPDWRFGITRPLADPAATRAALRLDDRPFPSVPGPGSGDMVPIRRGASDPGLYVAASGPVGASAPGWDLTLFLRADPTMAGAARNAALTALLAGLLIAAVAFGLLRRRRWTLDRQAALAGINAELERRVAERTEALNRSNSALAGEIVERETAETRVRRLRDELAQANRLSILGQIAAGVAHEINQPVAAIRAYAENGQRLIAGDKPEAARETLADIVGVTERIGRITEMLRGFARRGAAGVGPVAVDQAIDGALALLSGRIRDSGVEITRSEPPESVQVVAGRIRLEQILVNLLSNALDAMRDGPGREIAISVLAGPETVAITVRDTGPGLAPEVRKSLFMPFTTTKPTGLGLGLVISGDIAQEFGGSLRCDQTEGPGASFTLELRRAS
ncbi:MAG: ATP-binding protein [Amaricoccus sp.]